MILAVLYILVFSFFIFKNKFFKHNVISNAWFSAAFILKVIVGFGLTWVYTVYYPDRQTADIYKYFDDSKVIFSAWQQHHYSDYFKMLLGIGNDTEYFNDTYYSKMNHWSRHYDFGTYNDNHTIIRFNALALLFSFGNFYVHTIFMCFICTLGLTALFNTFVSYFNGKEKLLFASLFLIPSVLFWSSGVLKEGILMFALGFLFYSFFHIFIHKKSILLNVVCLFMAGFLLLINKNYLLLVSLPALFCFFCVNKFYVKHALLFYFSVYVIVFSGGIIISNYCFENNLLETFSLKQRDFINVSKGGVFIQNDKNFVRIAPDNKSYLDTISKNNFKIKQGSSYMCWKNENLNDTVFVINSTDTASYHLVWDLPLAGSTIHISRLEPTVLSLLKNAPQAIYNSLCKPGLLTAKSFLERFSAFENMFILLFLIVCTWFSKNLFNKNVLALFLFISITLLLLIGYTTPVAGAIMRYKVPVLPFLMLGGVLILDVNKFKLFFGRTKP